MKVAALLGERFKEVSADFQIKSHEFMVRGAYLKQLSNGIYSLYLPAKRIVNKIENIIREEMDKIDGQEVLFPVVMPASLWQESGRYFSIGSEMARFKDRSGNEMVLGMTHEEAAVHLAKGAAQSYANYPFMIYQIQTKFRDEPRSRGGLIRVREFTMKDAYSFHTSQEDLCAYYDRCHKAYEKIFARVGVPEVVSVKSDSGMMGGKVAHEFMLLTEIGEDSIVLCDACNYRSNMEVAECIIQNEATPEKPLEKVHTPDLKTIEDLCKFFKITPQDTCKAVVYQKNLTDECVVIFLRGDLDVNETKLRNFLGEEIHAAQHLTPESCDLTLGFIGAVNLNTKATVLYDQSLKGATNLVCGANEEDYHYSGFSVARDLKGENVQFHDFAKTFTGATCPVCGKKSIKIKRGIEVGNIFQLGTKSTESMEMKYVDKDGNLHYPIMGCYGIGVGRLMASVCEVRHDDFGPIWPISIAPWQVQICALRINDEEVRQAADKLYQELLEKGVEVLFDDRNVTAGVMFSEADLLGVPLRVVVSPKTCAKGCVEFLARDKSFSEFLPYAEAADKIRQTISTTLEKYL